MNNTNLSISLIESEMNNDMQMLPCIRSKIEKQHLFIIFDKQTLNSYFVLLKDDFATE